MRIDQTYQFIPSFSASAWRRPAKPLAVHPPGLFTTILRTIQPCDSTISRVHGIGSPTVQPLIFNHLKMEVTTEIFKEDLPVEKSITPTRIIICHPICGHSRIRQIRSGNVGDSASCQLHHFETESRPHTFHVCFHPLLDGHRDLLFHLLSILRMTLLKSELKGPPNIITAAPDTHQTRKPIIRPSLLFPEFKESGLYRSINQVMPTPTAPTMTQIRMLRISRQLCLTVPPMVGPDHRTAKREKQSAFEPLWLAALCPHRSLIIEPPLPAPGDLPHYTLAHGPASWGLPQAPASVPLV